MRGFLPGVLIALVVTACGGYAATTEPIRNALSAGRPREGLDKVDKALDVPSDQDIPLKIKEETSLLLLERGTILHGLADYPGSSRDWQVAEKHLELLDLQNDTAGNIGKWLFSDTATVYKAPAYEKLLLNTLNMMNYLARGNLEDARVEARRLTTMQDYLKNEQSEQKALLGLGSYLAGFTFEMSGRPDEAIRYYDEALAHGDYPSLQKPIARLAGQVSYRTERIDAVLQKAGGLSTETADQAKPATGTLLVVPEVGLGPHKEAMRIPIGAALVIAGAVIYGPGLSGGQRAEAGRLAAKGILTWLNFPVLKDTPHAYDAASVDIDGRNAGVESGLEVAQKVKQAWESIKGTVMVAAIVRMIARALIAEGAEAAGKGAGAGGVGSLLIGLAVQGTMTAADTPDTRSWVTLPARILLSRHELPAGKHKVTVTLSGRGGVKTISKEVDIPAGGFVVLPVSALR